MESNQSDIVRTTLTVPTTTEEDSLPSSPLTTISEIMGPSEALQQESESRQRTAEVGQSRAKAQLHDRSDIVPFKGCAQDTDGAGERDDVQHTSSNKSRIAKVWPKVKGRGGRGQSRRANPNHIPTYQSHEIPILTPGPAVHPQQFLHSGHPGNQQTSFMPPACRPSKFAAKPTPTSPFEAFRTHKYMTKSASEDEYDKSRGAFFTNLPPRYELKIGKPSQRTVEMSRNDVVSMRAELKEVDATFHPDRSSAAEVKQDAMIEGADVKRRSSMPTLFEKEERASVAGEREPVEQKRVEWVVEKKIKDIEERLGRMEENLQRVLELLEGTPGPTMVSGGVDGWWKEVKEEM